MSSGPGIEYKFKQQGLDDLISRIKQLHAEFRSGQLPIKEYKSEMRETNTIARDSVTQWNQLKGAIYATNPGLLEFTRTMSIFGGVASTVLSVTNAINLATIAGNQYDNTSGQLLVEIADKERELARLKANGLGQTEQAKKLESEVEALKNEYANNEKERHRQAFQNNVTLAASIFAIGGSAAQSYIGVKTLLASLKISPATLGIVGIATAFIAVALAALASGTIVGEAFNQNKQAVDEFRAELDKQFGDNPFTNYIILPLAAMIDELNGNKADWESDLAAMGDAWANFANPIIDTINAMRDFFHGGDKTGDFLHIKTSTELANESRVNRINNMLIGNPVVPTADQTQQSNLTKEQEKIIAQSKSFGQALTSAIQSSTNPMFGGISPDNTEQKNQTDVAKSTQEIIKQTKDYATQLTNEIISGTNPTLSNISTHIQQGNTLLTGLVDAAQQANKRAVYQSQIATSQTAAQAIQQKIHDLQGQIQHPNTPYLTGDMTDSERINAVKSYQTQSVQADQANAKITAQIQDLQKQLDQLNASSQASSNNYLSSLGFDNATSGLDSTLGSIGLSSSMGIGSIIASALGNSAGLGGAGISAEELQQFAQTGDYGIFTKAANRDANPYGVTGGYGNAPTKQDQINAWLKSMERMGLKGYTTDDAARALGYTHSSSGSSNYNPNGAFGGLPGQYGNKPSNSVFDPTVNYLKAATGFDGIVSSATHFLAGEAGPEHVNITPLSKGGGGTGVTVNLTVQGSLLRENDLVNIIRGVFKSDLRRVF